MYVRFVVRQRLGKFKHDSGLFMAAEHLREHAELNVADQKQLDALLEWFRLQLPLPHASLRDGTAIYWYKPSAKQHINKMWELAAFLQSRDYDVELITTEFAGRAIYQDEFQVGVIPHVDRHR